jgi:hypothetical protein
MECRRSADDRSLVAVGSWLVPWEFTGGEVPPVTGENTPILQARQLASETQKTGQFQVEDGFVRIGTSVAITGPQ